MKVAAMQSVSRTSSACSGSPTGPPSASGGYLNRCTSWETATSPRSTSDREWEGCSRWTEGSEEPLSTGRSAPAQERTPLQVSREPSRWLAGLTAARATRKADIVSRATHFTSVDLPAPFSPTRATTSPASTVTETSSSARIGPYRFDKPTTSSITYKVTGSLRRPTTPTRFGAASKSP